MSCWCPGDVDGGDGAGGASGVSGPGGTGLALGPWTGRDRGWASASGSGRGCALGFGSSRGPSGSLMLTLLLSSHAPRRHRTPIAPVATHGHSGPESARDGCARASAAFAPLARPARGERGHVEERGKARIARRRAKLFLDGHQLVIFRHAIRARRRARLDLARRWSRPRGRRWWCLRSRRSGAR